VSRATPTEQRQAKLQRQHQAKLRRLAESNSERRKSMAKKVRQPVEAKRGGGTLAAQALGPLGMMFGMMPGQVRLASREQQPRPPAYVAPKGKRGRGR
jgi:hypothetical protein